MGFFCFCCLPCPVLISDLFPKSDRTICNPEQRGVFPRRIVLTSQSVARDLAEVENSNQESFR
nr:MULTISPECIES: hypothetical protein [Morganella]